MTVFSPAFFRLLTLADFAGAMSSKMSLDAGRLLSVEHLCNPTASITPYVLGMVGGIRCPSFIELSPAPKRLGRHCVSRTRTRQASCASHTGLSWDLSACPEVRSRENLISEQSHCAKLARSLRERPVLNPKKERGCQERKAKC